jgi:hypothetical protein
MPLKRLEDAWLQEPAADEIAVVVEEPQLVLS